MTKVDTLRNDVIDKILAIKNKDFLVALDTLISLSEAVSADVEISEEQKTMLLMSEEDIKNGKLISQEAMDKRNLEWLNAK